MRRFERGKIKDFVRVELSNGQGFEIPYGDIKIVSSMNLANMNQIRSNDDLIVVRGLGKILIPKNVRLDPIKVRRPEYLFAVLKHCVFQLQYIDFQEVPKHARV